jgi:hypothetical protein
VGNSEDEGEASNVVNVLGGGCGTGGNDNDKGGVHQGLAGANDGKLQSANALSMGLLGDGSWGGGDLGEGRFVIVCFTQQPISIKYIKLISHEMKMLFHLVDQVE